MVVVDNCCQVRNAVARSIPSASIVLDVYHFLKRCVRPVSQLGLECIIHAAVVSCPHNVIVHDDTMPLVSPNNDAGYSLSGFRYLATIINGAKNPFRGAVAKDITEAILQTRAGKGVSASYRNQDEQSKRLNDTYQKWFEHGNVWSAAASKVSVSS